MAKNLYFFLKAMVSQGIILSWKITLLGEYIRKICLVSGGLGKDEDRYRKPIRKLLQLSKQDI